MSSVPHAQPNLILTPVLWNRYYKLLFEDEETEGGTESSKIVSGHTASKAGGVEERAPRCKPRSVGAPKPRIWPRPLAVSAGALGVVLGRQSHLDGFLMKKINFKNHRSLHRLKLNTHSSWKSIYQREFLFLLSGAEKKKKSNECYFILVHLRVSWVRKEEAFPAAKDKVQRPPSGAATVTPCGQAGSPQPLPGSPPTRRLSGGGR